ncbi:MAG: fumarylacetoacetate hydrolase family protein [Gammaproteobacteria bacterium]
MKIARYAYRGATLVGRVDVDAGSVTPLDVDHGAPDVVIGLAERMLGGAAPRDAGAAVAVDAVTWLAPIVRPRKNILCIGKNYRAHAHEFARSGFDASARGADDAVPQAPIVFTKAPCTVVGAHADIVVPWSLTAQVDYEGELGVVIGRPGRAIAAATAWDHVFAYTIINDVTARDLQARHRQWHLGKSIDTFCPMGPWLTTADEVDARDLVLECRVNGELRQHASTRDLIFDIPTLVSTLSASMTLETGDIIATGTPAGVGIGFEPPRFLAPGDRVEVTISGLGRIANTVV